MNNQDAPRREIREIAVAANSGEASDEQIARLDELIRSDRQLANYAARLFDQQAALAWSGAVSESNVDEFLRNSKSAVSEKLLFGCPPSRFAWSWPAIAVGIAFVLGGVSAMAIYRTYTQLTAPAAGVVDLQAGSEPAYEAHLVRSTACLWDGTSLNSPQIGSGLASGESLHLLEGLAEFKLNWATSGRATVSLEGPAAMMLASDGMPTLRFGRLTARIHTVNRPFVLETPVGRVLIPEYGSIGISTFGNEGEIHVFDGTAIFEPAWRTPDDAAAPLTIASGEAIRVQPGDNGLPSIAHHSADADYFTAQVSMSSDGLAIPPEYVKAVKGAGPIGYWRFERDEWPVVPNVMGKDLGCAIEGAVGRTVYQGNQAVDFGVIDQDGDIISNEPIDDALRDSYSIEFWIKPSHYHVGAVISLVGDKPTPTGVLPHGMLIELGGTGKIPTATSHPGCIRFLHRSPAAAQSGTSCYSKSPYTLRKWQHIVATKDGAKMRLYVNGDLVADGDDASALPSGLRLLVGRLYPSQSARPFIGQLDELALYNRALGPEEITHHYHLVRPTVVDEHGI